MTAATQIRPNWTVAQLSARESYAAARAFVATRRLNRLYTEVWCRFGSNLLRRGPPALRALAGRRHPEIPGDQVVSFTTSAVVGQLLGRFRGEETYETYLRVGRWFDRRVSAHLARHPLSPTADAFFTYSAGALETLRALGRRGVVALVDQMDAARVAYDMVRAEADKWPGWEPEPLAIPNAYFDRLAAEWEAAAGVVVNSEWTADALVRQGVPREKIYIVPLAYEPSRAESRPRSVGTQRSAVASGPAREPLVVLWLGNVVLQKGIQYLLAAARLLADRPIRFVVVGHVGISDSAVASAPASVEFVGRVTRDRATKSYQSADLFVFSTLSDGFGLTQLEAMSHGLPVIATPNCGSVVDHGIDGLVVPAGDAAALATAIAELDDDRDRLGAMGRAAVRKAEMFPLAAFADRLDAAYTAARGGQRPETALPQGPWNRK